MEAQGDTAIWDALAIANDQLSQYASKFPGVKKRIICLSDGSDTKSEKESHSVCEDLCRNKVLVDSFCLGDEDNADIRAVSLLSGGYKFVPKTLEQAMAICEMEPVLNQLDRPVTSQPRTNCVTRFTLRSRSADPEIVTRDIFPQRKQHPSLDDAFVALASFDGTLNGTSRPAPTTSAVATKDRSNANQRPARLLAEIRNLNANPHPRYEVFISESNMGFWKVLMQGPSEGPYSQGTWLLYLHMEEDYPAFPPKARFVTPVLHPNINRHGRVCHSILDRKSHLFPAMDFAMLTG